MKRLRLHAAGYLLGFMLVCLTTQTQPVAAQPATVSAQPETPDGTADTSCVYALTAKQFKTKIFNYEQQRTWKYEGTQPAVIDFYATWCTPCRVFEPVVNKVASDYKEQIVTYRVDIDQEKELAQLFGITSIPAVLFIPKEGKPSLAQGAVPEALLVRAVQELLLDKQ